MMLSWGFAVALPSASGLGWAGDVGCAVLGKGREAPRHAQQVHTPVRAQLPVPLDELLGEGFRAPTLQACPGQMPRALHVQHPAWCRARTRLTPPSNRVTHQAMDLASQFYVQLQMIARPTPQVSSRALRQPGRLVLGTSFALRAPMSHSGLFLSQAAPPFRPGIGLPEHGEALTASSYLIPPLPQILNATLKYFN